MRFSLVILGLTAAEIAVTASSITAVGQIPDGQIQAPDSLKPVSYGGPSPVPAPIAPSPPPGYSPIPSSPKPTPTPPTSSAAPKPVPAPIQQIGDGQVQKPESYVSVPSPPPPPPSVIPPPPPPVISYMPPPVPQSPKPVAPPLPSPPIVTTSVPPVAQYTGAANSVFESNSAFALVAFIAAALLG